MKTNHHKEWIIQAQYDLESAEILFKSGHYLHSLFFCHLALEKGLKAAYEARLCKAAPKTHNLSYLFTESGIHRDEAVVKFLKAMSELNIVSRYPDELRKYLRLYKKKNTANILKESKGIIKWIKGELEKSTGS